MKNNIGAGFFYLMLLIAPAIHLSCKSPGENNSDQSTSFVNKSWKLQGLSVAPAIDWDLDGKKGTDILAQMEDCEKDDLLFLRIDSVILRNEGKVKCEDEDEQERETGSWVNDKSQNKLLLKEDNEVQELSIVESNSGRLVLAYTWNATDGKSHKITAVYVTK